MSAGWMYYHKLKPTGKCPNVNCPTKSKRHYATRITASNGEDFWRVFCTAGRGELRSIGDKLLAARKKDV